MPYRGRRSGSNTRPVASDGAERRTPSRRLRNNRLLLVAVAAGVLLADQLTKLWALRVLDERTIHLFWTIRLRLIFNQGTAFGLGPSLAPLITVAAVLVSLLLIAATWSATSRGVAALAGLVLGGALGNLGDRAFRGGGFFGGSVVDFVDPQWWPVFNVADAAISVGVVIFAATLLYSGARGESRPGRSWFGEPLSEGSQPDEPEPADLQPGDPQREES